MTLRRCCKPFARFTADTRPATGGGRDSARQREGDSRRLSWGFGVPRHSEIKDGLCDLIRKQLRLK